MGISIKLVYYSQEDPRWRHLLYSNHRDPKQTIGTSGCGPTCFAMVASSILGKPILPPEAAEFAIKHGYRTYNNGTSWGYFASAARHYGLECHQTENFDVAKQALKDGALVIASMGPGHFTSGGHYVLLVAYKDGWVEVFDPNHDNTKYGADGIINQGVKNDGKVTAKEHVFPREARQFWIFPVSKGGDSMSEVDKKAFETLQQRVEVLEKRIPAPKWFVEEFGSTDLKGLIHDPQLTSEGWRILAIALRAMGYKKS